METAEKNEISEFQNKVPKMSKNSTLLNIPENRCRVSKVNSNFVASVRHVVVPLANPSESELLGNLTKNQFQEG